ncbi:hypothetical protein VTK73DRAFT_3571 [Phialemonium thermophilum]|uniref:Uncharacterized protein n=1 Tax=Phialemonium thermophilum TaxID=223376 RepID=A0ABR3WYT6_9PEZI
MDQEKLPPSSSHAHPMPSRPLSVPSIGGLSFAERKGQVHISSLAGILRMDSDPRHTERPPLADVAKAASCTESRPSLSKQRSDYFEKIFSVKKSSPAKERAHSEAIVMADVRTNVIVRIESLPSQSRPSTELTFRFSGEHRSMTSSRSSPNYRITSLKGISGPYHL